MFRRDLSGYLRDLLLSERATDRGYVDRSRIEAVIAQHESGAHDHHKTLWQLIVLEEWHRAFVDAPPHAFAASATPSLVTHA